jgi:hypothetical protein
MPFEKELIELGYKLVYQGGHHNVYCNGPEHVWTTGGWAGKWPIEEEFRGKCDCEYWKQRRK